MTKKSVATAIAITSLSTALLAQAPGTPKRAEPAKAGPRTSWGDPDLSGNYTNLYEAGTPMERPAQFEGRKLGDVTPEELKKFKLNIQETTISRFETPFDAPSNWWQDAFRLGASAQAWLITDPDDGHIPARTADGLARQRGARQTIYAGGSDSWEDRSLYDRFAIQYEMIHETRVIPIDRTPQKHLAAKHHLDMGDSRAHWDGDTLVVETTNFTTRSVYQNADPDTLKITERFTRTAPDKLRWSVTMDDPHTWTRPWTFSMPLTMNDAEPIQSYECHEGNYGLRNILSAARAEERDAAQATKP